MECVYLIRDNETGLHKIGMSTNWERRARQLQVGTTTTKVRVVTCKNAEKWERVLHAMFKHKRIPQSEWFRITAEEAIPKMEWLATKTNQRIVIGNWQQAQDGHYYRRRKSGSGNWYTEQKTPIEFQQQESRQLELIINNSERAKIQEARREAGYWPTKNDHTKVEWAEKDPTYTSVNGWIIILLIIGLLIILANFGKDDSKQSIPSEGTFSQPRYKTTLEMPASPVVTYVTTHNVNLRLMPDTASIIVSLVPIGQKVTEIERLNDWVHISYPGKTENITGWVHSSFLDTEENTLQIITLKLQENRKKLETAFFELVSIEKNLYTNTKKLILLEDELKELKLQPYVPKTDQASEQNFQDNTIVQSEEKFNQEGAESLENQIHDLEANLKKNASAYKEKRNQYQELKKLDDSYTDAYLKISPTQDFQKLTDNEQVSYADDSSRCRSIGCSLTIKDPTGRVIFNAISKTTPYFLYYTPDDTFRSFIIKQNDFHPYQTAKLTYGKLYVYDKTQGQYTLSSDDEAYLIAKMQVF